MSLLKTDALLARYLLWCKLIPNQLQVNKTIMELLTQYATELASFVAGLFGGSLLTITYTSHNNNKSNQSSVNQSGAKAGGDVVGGNKTTKIGK
jgi:uncharacterized membrane protein